NLSLLSARLGQDLARENIRLAQSGHLPTVNLNASTGVSNSHNHGSALPPETPANSRNSYNGQSSIGLSL
ncbi:outer membrane channel protein TolC, partial [Escherichia coli]